MWQLTLAQTVLEQLRSFQTNTSSMAGVQDTVWGFIPSHQLLWGLEFDDLLQLPGLKSFA